MGSKNRKQGRRLPAIVPRFLKGAVTIGAIPALVVACKPKKPMPPVVAYYGGPAQPVVAYYAGPLDATPDLAPPPPPVVAAYTPPPARPFAADAGVDASPPTSQPKKVKAAKVNPIPPPVVAAFVAPPPPVVAAYVGPQQPLPTGPQQPRKKK